MKQSVAIIGAGSSGLAAARHFLAQGFDVQVFEREDDLGGNWHYGKACSRVYRSTHTISSRSGTEFPDFPMPQDYPDYPHHSQILAYLKFYAAHFKLFDHIRFSTGVAYVEPLIEDDEGDDHAGAGPADFQGHVAPALAGPVGGRTFAVAHGIADHECRQEHAERARKGDESEEQNVD